MTAMITIPLLLIGMLIMTILRDKQRCRRREKYFKEENLINDN